MIDKIQTYGLAAKGLIYGIIGALTAMVAFDMGGQKAGKSDVVDFLQTQPFGNLILYLLSAGIIAYALWRLYTAFADPKSKGSDTTGITKRIGYFFSGLAYMLFGISIFSTTMGSGGGSGNREYYVAQLMDKPYGPLLITLIGIIIIGVGIYQVYKGYSGKYLEDLNPGYGRHQSKIKTAGKYGFMARGVVFAILGYFLMSAGMTENASMVRGTQGAFSFLQQQEWGTYLMGAVALGLLGYGIFMLYVSKDSRVHS